jgi:hypothetical protein
MQSGNVAPTIREPRPYRSNDKKELLLTIRKACVHVIRD